jgi:hypothetical protein
LGLSEIIKSLPARLLIPIVLILAGVGFVLVSLSSRFEIGDFHLVINDPLRQDISLAIGLLCIATAVTLWIILQKLSEGAATSTELTATDGAQEVPSTPDSRYVQVVTMNDAADFAPSSLLETASDVKLYSRTLLNVLNQHLLQIADVANRQGAVRILVMQPDPVLGDRLYPARGAAGTGEKVLKNNAESVSVRLARLRQLVTPGMRLEVKMTYRIPSFGMMLATENDGTKTTRRLLVQLNFLHTRTERDRPLLCIAEPSQWFGVFEREFEAVWNDATPWEEPTWVDGRGEQDQLP